MADIKKRILIVDDDPILTELASDILSADYEVFTARDGQEGWGKALQLKPDLVFTDLMMPRMHGFELCEKIKGPGGIAGARVVVVSSKPFSTDKAQAEAAGADGYIVKPYSPAALLGTAASMLASAGGKKAFAPAPREVPYKAPQKAAGPAAVPGAKLPIYVRFWGTRGSIPVPGAETARYGGNTACTEVRIGETLLIIDCGSGIRNLGTALIKEFSGAPITGHIFVGHTHWDHIQGFPFFVPAYNPKNTFTLYSVHGAHSSLESVFKGSMGSDYFPIPLAGLAGKLDFLEMTGPVDLGAARISFTHLNHPGVCIGFRIDAQGRSITYISDHEVFTRLNGDSELARRNDARVADFARGSDLLIREAQYTEEEYSKRRGWGHSTFADVLPEAVKAGVKRLAVFHHDPDHTDEMMDGHIKYCQDLVMKADSDMQCFAARDGLRIDL